MCAKITGQSVREHLHGSGGIVQTVLRTCNQVIADCVGPVDIQVIRDIADLSEDMQYSSQSELLIWRAVAKFVEDNMRTEQAIDWPCEEVTRMEGGWNEFNRLFADVEDELEESIVLAFVKTMQEFLLHLLQPAVTEGRSYYYNRGDVFLHAGKLELDPLCVYGTLTKREGWGKVFGFA